MKSALIYINYFYPGFNSGGQAKTINNLVDLIDNKVKFKIVTRNHDFNSKEKYNLSPNQELNYKSKAKIIYSNQGFSFKMMNKMEENFDNIIHCGFFEPFSIRNFLKLIFFNSLKRYIILPMGVFSPGAIKYKKIKKKIYIFFFNFFKLYKKVIFAFSSKEELDDALIHIKKIPNYFFLLDIPSIQTKPRIRINKSPKVIFLSRIHPKKNLDYAIRILDKLNKNITLNIYGPLEDKVYWELCKKTLNDSSNITKWKYCGITNNRNTSKVFSKHDFFIFPTRGENFGHVIFESMINGCIPITSNLTPWTQFFMNRLDFSCNLNDINCFIQKGNYLLDNFKSIKNIKQKYFNEAKLLFKNYYGKNYIDSFITHLL
jgi:glycosyltransferase involved in cell wall biosynthesis